MFSRVEDLLHCWASVHPDTTVYVSDYVVSTTPVHEGVKTTLYSFMEEEGISNDPDIWDEAITALENEGVWEV